MPGLSSPVRRGPGEPVGRKSREGSNPSPGASHSVQILSKAVMKGNGFHRVESEDLRRRVDYSYEKYGWTVVPHVNNYCTLLEDSAT